jgi:uncharacterized damage-inducible protein DinB
MTSLFLDFSISKLRQLAERIGDCLNRLNYDQVWLRGSESQNAIGNVVLHLRGNVRQWIGFGVGRMPDIRVRDEEFAARGSLQPADLARKLHDTVEEACAILGKVTAERLAERMQVQKYDVTVLEGIYHVVEHFSQHTGQVIFMTKLLTDSDPSHHEKTP